MGRPNLHPGLCIAALTLVACSSTGQGQDHDPLEGMNRKIFWFNDKFDRYFLEPVAIGYDWTVPDPIQRAVTNFVTNLRFPLNFINNLLQSKPKAAGEETLRFLVNSTIGIGGLLDPATGLLGLDEHNEDFGQTFATWGIPAGPYLVLPFFGPSNIRDGIGLIPNSLGEVTIYVLNTEAFVAYSALRIVDQRARLIETIDSARQASLDYYVFARNAYNQLRQAEIADGAESSPGEGDPVDGVEDLYDDGLYDDSLYDDEVFDDDERSGEER